MTATLHPFELHLVDPIPAGEQPAETRRGFVLEITDGPGGLGEASPFPPVTESGKSCERALRRAVEGYKESGWRGAFRAVAARRNRGTVRAPAARHAVALAYLDWRSKRVEKPLYRYLGKDNFSNPLPVYATIGDLDAVDLVDRAREAMDAGFGTVKVEVGNRSVDGDVERLEAVGGSIDGANVIVDAMGRWSFDQAVTFIRKTDNLNLQYLEQPLAADDLSGHADLRGLGPAVALDESLAEYRPRTIIDHEAADVFVLEPMVLGGPDIARAMAELVRRRGYTVVLGTTFDSVVARTGAIHVAASLPNLAPSGLATASYLQEDLAPDPTLVTDGFVQVPDSSGLGIPEVAIPDA